MLPWSGVLLQSDSIAKERTQNRKVGIRQLPAFCSCCDPVLFDFRVTKMWTQSVQKYGLNYDHTVNKIRTVYRKRKKIWQFVECKIRLDYSISTTINNDVHEMVHDGHKTVTRHWLTLAVKCIRSESSCQYCIEESGTTFHVLGRSCNRTT